MNPVVTNLFEHGGFPASRTEVSEAIPERGQHLVSRGWSDRADSVREFVGGEKPKTKFHGETLTGDTMSRVTRREWYERVNAEWPAQVPPLTAEEAIRAGRRLYRFALHRTFSGKVRVTSGNRYTWIRRGEMVVNPERGWHGLVHLLSHYADDRLRPDAHHDGAHARLELRMIREVKRRGWLDGRLKRPAKPTVVRDPRRERYARILARLTSWEAKKQRAERAIARLNRSRKYYERSGSAPHKGDTP